VQYRINQDVCKRCGMCMRPGCPAITKAADGTISVNDTLCNGCGLCGSICSFGAIERVEV
ncbi:MAG: indolepyruvate ferredoxin oxidoreductase subunit alpha, partial [Lachnospiraceae bacterium]